jgi:nucleoside-diphosphate-sugar epimerase
MSRMFFFGYGYTASHLAQLLRAEGWSMAGTTRTTDKVNGMWDQGVEPHVWNGKAPIEGPGRIMKNVTHILHSVPPTTQADPVLRNHLKLLIQLAPQLEWYGYISTTSVYGDTQGEVADESYEPNPSLPRGKSRLRVEKRHRQLFKKKQLPLHIFRAGGIYGPGRSLVRRALQEPQQIIHKEGHITSRIHVDDLAQILRASIEQPNPGSVYNCVDDMPAPMEDPMKYALERLGKPVPPSVPYEQVEDKLKRGMKSFYEESRQVSNAKIKSELGVTLKYPTYREGYDAIISTLKSGVESA